MRSWYLRGLLLILCVALWVTGASRALAADATPPGIDHRPVAEAISETAVRISAHVTDNVSVRRVTLFMRAAGTASYYAIPMRVDGIDYAGVIPAQFVSAGSLEYYIEAIDTSGNIATSPATSASINPYHVTVTQDESFPSVSLRGPKGAVESGSFLVVLVLDDEGNNIDPDSVRLIFNGRDVTNRAQVSARAIRFLAQAHEVTSISSLEVRVADRAGNETRRSFRIYRRPLVSGDFSLELGAQDGESSFDAAINFGASWGPFSAFGELRSGDSAIPDGALRPTNRFTLAYESRSVELQVIDVTTTLSSFTATGYAHRGYNAELKWNGLETRLASGIGVQAVQGETYPRRFLGARQSVDLGLAELGVNAVRIDDQEVPGIPGNPEQNYVLSIDAAVRRWGLQASIEASTSLSFPNARGNVWDSLDQLAGAGKPYAQVVEVLEKVPKGLRRYVPLPHPNYWILDPPYIDAGMAIEVRTPLPGSTLAASYFRIGPDFRTLAGTATSDREGYSARWASERLADGSLRLSASYESFEDNVQSILRTLVGDVAPTGLERNRFTTVSGTIHLRTPGRIRIDVMGEREETNGDRPVTALLADQEKNRIDTLRAGLGNVDFGLGTYNGGINTSLSLSKFSDFKSGLNDKQTSTAKVVTTLRRGAWSYELGLTSKREVDAIGTVVSSPAIAIGTVWSIHDNGLGKTAFQRVRAEARTVLGQSIGVSKNTQTLTNMLALRMSPTPVTRWTLQLRTKRIVNHLANIQGTDVSALVRYAYLF